MRSTTYLTPDLRFALYKDAMLQLQKGYGKKAWDLGWPLIRGVGKKLLKDPDASDAECADAVILLYGEKN